MDGWIKEGEEVKEEGGKVERKQDRRSEKRDEGKKERGRRK